MKANLICGDTLSSCKLSYVMVGFGVTRVYYFSKIINVEVRQVVNQVEIALTLDQI